MREFSLRSATYPILMGALLLRIWRLDFHSIWFDEAVSLKWAAADPNYTWQTTIQLVEDKHPPLYYVSLHYWQELLGLIGYAHSDAGLRMLGVLLGVAAVWGLIALVRRIDGPIVAYTTGILAGLSPILIWYSQELRMFLPATCALIWSAYLLQRALETDAHYRRLGVWALMSLALLAALYIYLFSAFLLPAAGLILLVSLPATGWRRFWEGSIALVITGLLYLRLAHNAWQVNSAESTPGQPFDNFVGSLLHLLENATIWRVAWPEQLESFLVYVIAVAALAGLVLPSILTGARDLTTDKRPGRLDGRIWLWVWIGSALLIANILLVRSASIFTQDRYLLFLIPFLLWAIARGIVQLGRRVLPLGLVLGAIIVAATAYAVPQTWSLAHAREDWRSTARYIIGYQEHSSHLPASIVVHVDYLHDALEWYVRQSATIDELPIFFPYGGKLGPDQVDDVVAPPLEGIVEFGSHTLWLVQSHLDGVDDDRVVERWLTSNFPVVTELFPSGIKVSGYMLRNHYDELPSQLAPQPAKPTTVAPGLNLVACETTTPRVSARDRRLHPPSGWVHIRLWWQAESDIEVDYRTTARVIGPEGIWGDRLHRSGEVMERWPTSTWPPDQYVRDELDINMNPVTPEGTYQIIVGVITPSGEEVGTTVSCGEVDILK